MNSLRLTYILFIAGFFLLVPGCSWKTAFVVQNNSDNTIRVEYSFCCEGAKYWYMPPKLVESSKLGYRGPNWNEMSDAVHSYSEKEGDVSLEIPVNFSALVNTNLNYVGYRKGKPSDLNVLKLTINSPEGQISFTGNELAKAFKKRSKNLYILKYE